MRPTREPTVTRDGPRINEEITVLKVRLIDAAGEMLGVMSTKDALQEAYKVGLDLVEISPQGDPPVCKILDYGKYRYELQKKKAEAKKKQKIIEVKEVQLRPNISENDLQVKIKAMTRFLDEGNKVKITMRFRGREVTHHEIGLEVLHRIKALFEPIAKIENQPRLEGKQMMMVLSPLVLKA